MVAHLNAPFYPTQRAKKTRQRISGYSGVMPNTGALGYLIEYIEELGYAAHISDGLAPITWQEIGAWCELTRTPLELYEVQLLHGMSRTYVDQYYKSLKPDCPWPCINVSSVDHERLGAHILNIFKRRRPCQRKFRD